jgi:hypothetical protein
MTEESLVRNIQAAYGHYVNRRMWDDVVDLFAANGCMKWRGRCTAVSQACEACSSAWGPPA